MVTYDLKDYNYNLPDALIAAHPSREREQSRLLHLDRKSGKLKHLIFDDIREILTKNDLLVINNTMVRKSRFFACSNKGRTHEIIILSLPDSSGELDAVVSSRKKLRSGDFLTLPGDLDLEFVSPKKDFAIFRVKGKLDEGYFEKFGAMPIPPYMKRGADKEDNERYQSIFAEKIGASASPTASLHFTPGLLEKIRAKGIEVAFLTLYIGFGTFSPIRKNDIREHQMHEEEFEISRKELDKIFSHREKGGRIIAVGTTSLRLLESLFQAGFRSTNERPPDKSGSKKIFSEADESPIGEVSWEEAGKTIHGKSSIFIYPPFRFHLCDSLLTNFHTPKSSLLLLVSAFYDRESVLHGYAKAIEKGYRFFSYGDAMFIE